MDVGKICIFQLKSRFIAEAVWDRPMVIRHHCEWPWKAGCEGGVIFVCRTSIFTLVWFDYDRIWYSNNGDVFLGVKGGAPASPKFWDLPMRAHSTRNNNQILLDDQTRWGKFSQGRHECWRTISLR